ncbi:MAG: chemotaxis protein CheD [Candidatus Glassbacteria bacterium]|nr:chemotaxis protein CheD [Candidatus Glassbacteria bacterium]
MSDLSTLGPRTGLRSVTVDISDFKVSNDPNDMLITYSLGSCLGLSICDPAAGVAGLVHCMLPLSKTDPAKAERKPGMFVDTGIPALMDAAFKLGAKKNRLIIKAAGCGQLLDEKTLFRIGERNYTVMRKLLWKNNLLLESEHTGGSLSRTVRVVVETGKVFLKASGKEILL